MWGPKKFENMLGSWRVHWLKDDSAYRKPSMWLTLTKPSNKPQSHRLKATPSSCRSPHSVSIPKFAPTSFHLPLLDFILNRKDKKIVIKKKNTAIEETLLHADKSEETYDQKKLSLSQKVVMSDQRQGSVVQRTQIQVPSVATSWLYSVNIEWPNTGYMLPW